MLLEVEADQNMCDESGSLMDIVMMGMITTCSMFFIRSTFRKFRLNQERI